MITPNSASEKWENNWKSIKKIDSGAQGTGFLVHRDKDTTKQIYFLKVLNDQKSKLCRDRMYAEVCRYETLDFPGIPKLIESNAKFFKDLKYELYLVTEYISGSRLDKKTKTNANNVKKCILRLSEIISYCHSHDIVHRDIKPSNIILRNDKWEDPVLVDFGLSHHDDDGKKANSIHQEIGNRFLRLPEFAPGSALKRDPRSDITLCAGIFFYLLTNKWPSLLIDEKECMPHQRIPEKNKLLENSEGYDKAKLLSLFDRAFDISIDRRFQTIEDFANAINALDLQLSNKSASNTQAQAERIRSKVNNPSQESIRQKMRLLEGLMRTINQTLSEVSSMFDNVFNTTQTNYAPNPANLEIRNTIGLIYQENTNIKFIQTYIARIAGNEAVLFAGDEILFRCDAKNDINNVKLDLKEILKSYIIAEIDIVCRK